MENKEAVLSDVEREAERRTVIERLLSLERVGVNQENWREVEMLEKRLHEIDPPKTSSDVPVEMKVERRVRTEDREAIKRVLAEINQFRQ